MGKFFRVFFATIFGTVFGVIILIALFIGIIVASSSSTLTTNYEDKNVLIFKNIVSIGEISTPSIPNFITGTDDGSKLGLYDILWTLERAANDDRIQGIVFDDIIIDAGYATVQELVEAFKKFKESGKFIVAHFNSMSQKTFLLASVCDEISMNGEGMAEFHGISSSSVHYKDLLEKIGINPIVIRCGKYKSYVESVTSTKMSTENKEQKKAYIDELWKDYLKTIKNNKNINSQNLNKIADSTLLCLPEELLSYNIIDTIQFYDEFWNSIKNRMDIDSNKSVSAIPFKTYMEEWKQKMPTDTTNENSIALVVAQGSIDMGTSEESSIGSKTYVDVFKKIRKDSAISAVVFRINSGGGSALASELIWREVALTAKEKPVIVSMGDMAASGGYYIASPATKIMATPSTLTGSIGVFGMSMTAEKLLEKIGVQFDTVSTHSHSDFGNTIARNLDPVEIRAIEKSIDKTYLTFKQRVSAGRHISINDVETIAQGRIWNGYDALSHQLVDTLGGLAAALQFAADAANTSTKQVRVFPQAKTLLETMYSKFSVRVTSLFEKNPLNSEIQHIIQTIPSKSGIYTQIPYTFSIE